MSHNDVRDILSLPNRAGPAGGPSRAAARAPPQLPGDARPKQRPEGMSRELYALLGPNAPSLVMAGHGAGGAVMTLDGIENADATGARAFQPKFTRRPTAAARKWAWAPFRNPARSDTCTDSAGAVELGAPRAGDGGLILHHWKPLDVGADAGDELDATWMPFNTASQVFHYSSEEYIQYLRDDEWTREETDYLLELCETYDLRFIVIADRYEWPGKQRSMEDLKARYYTVARRLIRERISNEDVDTRQAQLQTFAFDKQQEVERKRAVQKLFLRTPEQLAEEEALYVEARRLEQNETKFAREREDLLRLLGGVESLSSCSPSTVSAVGAGIVWPPGVAQGDAQADADSSSKSGKRRKIDNATPTPTTPSAKSKDPKQDLQDSINFVSRFLPNNPNVLRMPYPNLIGTPSVLPPVSSTGAQSTKAETHAHHGAYLRSMRMLSFRPNQYLRAIQAMAELRPPVGSRLVYPTATNVEKWETLLGAVASGLEMKKQLDRVDAELRVVQARLAALETGGAHTEAMDPDAAQDRKRPATDGQEAASGACGERGTSEVRGDAHGVQPSSLDAAAAAAPL
ncbi:swr complex subunit [Malassezia sp. CBS 17886]|nr:swr complex subunit [Malassezia sp. CBS 17886]